MTSTSMAFIGFALLASFSGEVLWGIAAYAFRQRNTADFLYGDSSLFVAFLRGSFVFPVIVCAVLSLRSELQSHPQQPQPNKLACLLYYTLAGGVAGLLLSGPGFEHVFGKILSSRIPQAALLIFISALVCSFLPLLALLALARFPRVSPGAFLFLEFGPAFLSVTAALPALLLDLSSTGRMLPAGLLPNVVLNFLMFVSARLVLRRSTGAIKLSFPNIPWA